jgi:hypothetical protein
MIFLISVALHVISFFFLFYSINLIFYFLTLNILIYICLSIFQDFFYMSLMIFYLFISAYNS